MLLKSSFSIFPITNGKRLMYYWSHAAVQDIHFQSSCLGSSEGHPSHEDRVTLDKNKNVQMRKRSPIVLHPRNVQLPSQPTMSPN